MEINGAALQHHAAHVVERQHVEKPLAERVRHKASRRCHPKSALGSRAECAEQRWPGAGSTSRDDSIGRWQHADTENIDFFKKVSTHPPQFVDGAYLRRVCLSFDAARVVPTVFVTESSSRVVMSQLPWASSNNVDVGEVNA